MTAPVTAQSPLHPDDFYHICFAVPDLAKAMKELSDMLGVTFGNPVVSQL